MSPNKVIFINALSEDIHDRFSVKERSVETVVSLIAQIQEEKATDSLHEVLFCRLLLPVFFDIFDVSVSLLAWAVFLIRLSPVRLSPLRITTIRLTKIRLTYVRVTTIRLTSVRLTTARPIITRIRRLLFRTLTIILS